MAFRHSYFRPVPVDRSQDFTTIILKPLTSSGNSSTFGAVSVDDFTLNGSLPSPEDYTLDKLLAANVPLQRVDISLDDVPSEENIENFVNNNLKINENEN